MGEDELEEGEIQETNINSSQPSESGSSSTSSSNSSSITTSMEVEAEPQGAMMAQVSSKVGIQQQLPPPPVSTMTVRYGSFRGTVSDLMSSNDKISSAPAPEIQSQRADILSGFRKLPLELRIRIWKDAMPSPVFTFLPIDPSWIWKQRSESEQLGKIFNIGINGVEESPRNVCLLTAEMFNDKHSNLKIQEYIPGPNSEDNWRTICRFPTFINIDAPLLLMQQDVRLLCGNFSRMRLYAPRIKYLNIMLDRNERCLELPWSEAFPNLHQLSFTYVFRWERDNDAMMLDLDEDLETMICQQEKYAFVDRVLIETRFFWMVGLSRENTELLWSIIHLLTCISRARREKERVEKWIGKNREGQSVAVKCVILCDKRLLSNHLKRWAKLRGPLCRWYRDLLQKTSRV